MPTGRCIVIAAQTSAANTAQSISFVKGTKPEIVAITANAVPTTPVTIAINVDGKASGAVTPGDTDLYRVFAIGAGWNLAIDNTSILGAEPDDCGVAVPYIPPGSVVQIQIGPAGAGILTAVKVARVDG